MPAPPDPRGLALVLDEETTRLCGHDIVKMTGLPAWDVETAGRSGRELLYIGRRWPSNVGLRQIAWFHAIMAGVEELVTDCPAGVLLTRTVGGMPRRIAEYVLCHMLAHAQHVIDAREAQLCKQWRKFRPSALLSSRAVVIGTGEIGAAIAALLEAVGVSVYGVATEDREQPHFVRVRTSIDALGLESIDWVIAALPSTPRTRGLLNEQMLQTMRGAFLINVGRGDALPLTALESALNDGHVAGAVLDVVAQEPWSGDMGLWEHPSVTITPHISGPLESADVVEDFAAAWTAVTEGRWPPNAVKLARGY